MKSTIYFFRHCVKPVFVAFDGSTTDSILNAAGFLCMEDADRFMLRQPDDSNINMYEMPVWEWIARCNEAKDTL